MNILAFSLDFPPLVGGIELFIYQVCRQLAIKGHNICVVTRSVAADTEFDRQQIFPIHRYSYPFVLSSIFTIGKMIYIMLIEKTEVFFFGHFGSTHLLGGVLAKKIFKIPYVILVHGTDVNAYLYGFTWVDRLFSRIILKNAHGIIANSRTTKQLIEKQGYPSARIHIVNPGTDTDKFRPCENVDIIKHRLNISGRKVLLSVGRLIKRKGHEKVIRALPQVTQKVPNVLFLIIGKGEEEIYLKKLVQDMKLDGSVRFLGYVSDREKISYYQSCDVFIMPSFEIKKREMNDYEGFGIVYLEANACGKPVIGGRSGGTEDAVIDGVTGLLVDPHDPYDISRAIIQLLTDPDYAKRLVENGRKRVEEKFNWSLVGDKIETVLTMMHSRSNG